MRVSPSGRSADCKATARRIFLWYLISLPFYFLLFWISALPWSPFFLTHRRRLFGAWRPDRTDTYLLINAALIFVILP